MRNRKQWLVLPVLLISSMCFLAGDLNDFNGIDNESIGYVRVNRNTGICTFYLKEGSGGKLVPVTNESRSTTAPNFGTIKYNGENFKTTSSRFQLTVENMKNGFVLKRESPFVSFTEEVTVINEQNEIGVGRFFKIKLTITNLKPLPAKVQLRYVFDSFSKESKEAIILNDDIIVKEGLRVNNFTSIQNVGYVTDFNMKPIWFNPEYETRKEVDFMVVGNWKKLNNTPWFSKRLVGGDFFSYPESRSDSAVAFYFKEVALDQNESVSYSFQLEGGRLSSFVRNNLRDDLKDGVEINESAPGNGDGVSTGNGDFTYGEITVTEKIIDNLLKEIDEQMLRVDSLTPEELANLTGKIETLERYKEVYEKSKK